MAATTIERPRWVVFILHLEGIRPRPGENLLPRAGEEVDG
jgi:hypothetical protein